MGWLWYALLWVVLAAVYVVIVLSSVPGLREERFGRMGHRQVRGLGEWLSDSESPDGIEARKRGLIREERIWPVPGPLGIGRRYLKQVRYRSEQTGEVEIVDPEMRLTRSQVAALRE